MNGYIARVKRFDGQMITKMACGTKCTFLVTKEARNKEKDQSFIVQKVRNEHIPGFHIRGYLHVYKDPSQPVDPMSIEAEEEGQDTERILSEMERKRQSVADPTLKGWHFVRHG